MKSLLQERLNTALKKSIHTAALVLKSSGAPLVFLLFLLSFLLAYRAFLHWLPPSFPVIYPLTVLLAYLLFVQRIYTWLKPADLVFLLPMETHMATYFRHTLWINLGLTLMRAGIILAILYPFYQDRFHHAGPFWSLASEFMLLAVWNTTMVWLEDRQALTYPKWNRWAKGIRLALNLILIYLFLTIHHLAEGLLLMIPVGYCIGIWRKTPSYPYPWILWIKKQQTATNRWLAFFHWLADAKPRKRKIRATQWFFSILNALLPQKDALSYLYWRSLIRKSEIGSMYIRTTIWVLMWCLLLPLPWLIIALYLVSLWLSSIQLSSLKDDPDYPILYFLYPWTEQEKQQSIQKMSWLLLSIQATILAIGLFVVQRLSLIWILLLWLFSIAWSYRLAQTKSRS